MENVKYKEGEAVSSGEETLVTGKEALLERWIDGCMIHLF